MRRSAPPPSFHCHQSFLRWRSSICLRDESAVFGELDDAIVLAVPGGTELEDLMTLAALAAGIGHPEIAVGIDRGAVRRQVVSRPLRELRKKYGKRDEPVSTVFNGFIFAITRCKYQRAGDLSPDSSQGEEKCR